MDFSFQFERLCLRFVKVVSGADTNKTVEISEHARLVVVVEVADDR